MRKPLEIRYSEGRTETALRRSYYLPLELSSLRPSLLAGELTIRVTYAGSGINGRKELLSETILHKKGIKSESVASN